MICSFVSSFFIGPESDHWLCLSLTHSLTHSLPNSCLVNLMPVNDANCLMMSQQLLKAVKRMSTLEKSCASCLQMAKAVKLSPVGKCTINVKLVWKPKVLRFDKILISLPNTEFLIFPRSGATEPKL